MDLENKFSYHFLEGLTLTEDGILTQGNEQVYIPQKELGVLIVLLESAGFVQQSDALRATPDIAVHPVAPNVKFGAGGGIGPLSVDHKLVGKGVLVQPGCGGQVIRPAFPVPGQAVCRALGKGKVFFGFAWHFCLLLQILGYKNSGQPFLGCPPRVYNNWVIVDFEVLMMNVYFSSLSGGRT